MLVAYRNPPERPTRFCVDESCRNVAGATRAALPRMFYEPTASCEPDRQNLSLRQWSRVYPFPWKFSSTRCAHGLLLETLPARPHRLRQSHATQFLEPDYACGPNV